MVDIERDSWILLAAQLPEAVEAFMSIKRTQIEDEGLRRLHLELGDLID